MIPVQVSPLASSLKTIYEEMKTFAIGFIAAIAVIAFHPSFLPVPGPNGPSAAVLKSIDVSPASAVVSGTGATQQFIAMGSYSDGSTKQVQAKWSSALPSVASVDANGLSRGLALGSTMIIADVGGIRGGATLQVGGSPTPTPTPTPTPDPHPWIPPGPPPPPTPTPSPMGDRVWEWRTIPSDPNYEGYGTFVDGEFVFKNWRPKRAN